MLRSTDRRSGQRSASSDRLRRHSAHICTGMERSEWQIAASAARFDGGRDRGRDRAQATVADMPSELRARPTMGSSAVPRARPPAAVAAAPGVEVDWAGNIVRKPTRKTHTDATVSVRMHH
jgi:hypothetical protein